MVRSHGRTTIMTFQISTYSGNFYGCFTHLVFFSFTTRSNPEKQEWLHRNVQNSKEHLHNWKQNGGLKPSWNSVYSVNKLRLSNIISTSLDRLVTEESKCNMGFTPSTCKVYLEFQQESVVRSWRQSVTLSTQGVKLQLKMVLNRRPRDGQQKREEFS